MTVSTPMTKLLRWMLGAAVAVALLLGVGLSALQRWIGTEDFRLRAEREATSAVGVPVKLGLIELDLWPLPALAVNDIAVQSRPPLSLKRAELRPNWAGLLQGRLALSTVVLRHALVVQQGVDSILATLQKKKLTIESPRGPETQNASKIAWTVDRVVLDDVTWQGGKGDSITIDADARLGADAVPDTVSMTLIKSQIKGLGDLRGTEAKLQREGSGYTVAIELKGGAEKLLRRGSIKGQIGVQMPATPGAETVLQGQLGTRDLDLSLVGDQAPPLTGRLEAQTTLSARAANLGGLLEVLQTQSRFTVRNAVVHGIDLAKAVKTVGLNRGGETPLDVLAGQVRTQGKAIQLSNLVASSGVLSASGNVAVAPSRTLSGRINVELGSSVLPAAAKGAVGVPLVVGGTLDAPEVTLTRAALIGAAIGTVIMPGMGTGAGASLGDKVGEKLKGLFGR